LNCHAPEDLDRSRNVYENLTVKNEDLAGHEAKSRPDDPPLVDLKGIEELVADKGYHQQDFDSAHERREFPLANLRRVNRATMWRLGTTSPPRERRSWQQLRHPW